MSQSKDTRTRNYATVVYPESAPSDWLDILSDHHVPCFVSPYHEFDFNADNSLKKPHYHVLLAFDGPKTVQQAVDIFQTIGGVGCEIIKSFRSYARYLCHLDNPDKHQYSVQDVKQFGGIDYYEIISSSADRYFTFEEMMDFCDQYNVSSFYLLSKYARKFKPDWFRILCDSGTVYMKEFLKSRDWSVGKGIIHIVDQNTGEEIL